MSNRRIDELEKRIDLLNLELEKSNLLANKNLPILVRIFFIFLFFLIMGIFKPDLVIKIIEISINSIGALKALGI